ncbi:MAG TPA: UDP-2,3-diacylglucosamine hydrolase [Thermotogota bacterium]|nr:UDP-2,3-diacylglucosamine hydrolase [Thermotogota bacterium]HRW93013.1 UDP-2,3-diacylglucosamine hydrolase [Thermotogota bacterium]
MQRVFISDLHMGDGFLDDNFTFDTDLVELLEELMASGKQTELVILGDALELVETRVVKEIGLVSFDEVLEKIDERVIDDIAANHPKVFHALRKFLRGNRICYVIGNHDYYFLRKEKLRDRFRELLVDGDQVEFAPYFYDREWGVFAYHGSNFDPANRFGKDRKTGQIVPPIGDFMTRYMMVNFREKLVNGDFPESIPRDYDDVRPNIDIFDWIEYVMETYDLSINLMQMWVGELIKMLRTVYARQWMKSNYPKAHRVSNLFINKMGGIRLGRFIILMISKLRALKRTDYMRRKAQSILIHGKDNPKKRFTESDFWGFCEMPQIDYGRLHGLLFAHRHKFDNFVFPSNGDNKFYINTGTWRKVIERGGKRDIKRFVHRQELSSVVIREHNKHLDIQCVMKNVIGNRNLSRASIEVG